MRFETAAAVTLVLAIGVLPARADDASDRMVLASRLVDVMHYTANVHRMLPMLTAQLRITLKKAGQVGTGDLDQLDRAAAAHADEMSADYRGKMAKVYATAFSKEDLAAQLAFYESPTGQRILDKQLVIGKASLEIGGEIGRQLAIFAEQDAKKRHGGAAPPK